MVETRRGAPLLETMRISQLELWTSRLSEQRRFYAQVLGLPVTDDGAQRFTLQVGETRLVWHQAVVLLPGVYHFAFNIPENQFAVAKA
jgi:catechol-2,3-dioxygenase